MNLDVIREWLWANPPSAEVNEARAEIYEQLRDLNGLIAAQERAAIAPPPTTEAVRG